MRRRGPSESWGDGCASEKGRAGTRREGKGGVTGDGLHLIRGGAITRVTPHPGLCPTFPSRGRLAGDHQAKAGPVAEQWYGAE